MSCPWLSSEHPDPKGWQRQLFCGALNDRPDLEGFFFDFASCFQKPRTNEEEAIFHRALLVIGDLFASAIGTTVFEMKEIPPRPAEFDLPYDDRPYDERGW